MVFKIPGAVQGWSSQQWLLHNIQTDTISEAKLGSQQKTKK